MPFDFGPELIQLKGYLGAEACPFPRGGVLPPSGALEFYDATRRQGSRGALAAAAVVLPILLFALALGAGGWVLTGAPFPAGPGVAAPSPLSQALFGNFCQSGVVPAALSSAVFGAGAHYALAHLVLLATCGLVYFGGARSARNVLMVHFENERNATAIGFGLPLVGGGAAFLAGWLAFGGLIADAFQRISPFPAAIAGDPAYACLTLVAQIEGRLAGQAFFAMLCLSIAVAALVLAAAVIAYRFDLPDIDGRWADSYVLRHKLKSLLTLFFLGSVLLVGSNFALSAVTAIPDVVAAEAAVALAPAAAKADAGASTCLAFCFAPGGGGKAGEAVRKPQALDVPETLAQTRTLRGALLNFAGALASLMLIAIFAPAFYSLTGDIEVAGKTHASADNAAPAAGDKGQVKYIRSAANPPAVLFQISDALEPEIPLKRPAPAYSVAGFRAVQDWKDRHGLTVTFAQMTGSFVAVLAPIVSGGVLDLAKLTLG